MLVRETPHAVPWVTAHDYSDALMYPKGYGYKLWFKRVCARLFSDDKAPRRNASVINYPTPRKVGAGFSLSISLTHPSRGAPATCTGWPLPR